MKYFIQLLLLIGTIQLSAQVNETKNLNKVSLAIQHLADSIDFVELHSLLNILSEKKIIGLGEATHGTKQFFQVKQKLCMALVENLDYKIIIFESHFTNTEEMNSYVSSGKGNPYNALIGMGMGFMYNQEMYKFFEWIRNYNNDRPIKEQVKVYGCDFTSPQKTAIKIKLLLKEKGIEDESLIKPLEWLSNGMSNTNFFNEELKNLNNLSNNLKKLSKNYFGKELMYYRFYIRLIEQYFEYKDSNMPGKIRDKYMAENCEKIMELEEVDKAVISSHNLHIAKDGLTYKYPTLGDFLYQSFGKNFYSLATGFAEGTFRAVDVKSQTKKNIQLETPSRKSHDEFLSKCDYPIFFLDFKSIQNAEIFDELSEIKDMWTIGERFYSEKRALKKVSLSNNFDGIIFFKKTSAPSPLSWDLIDK